MADYDLSIHQNPDAQVWAKFFREFKRFATIALLALTPSYAQACPVHGANFDDLMVPCAPSYESQAPREHHRWHERREERERHEERWRHEEWCRHNPDWIGACRK